MGMLIDRVAIAESGWRSRHSALRLAVKSAEDCLRGAGRTADEVDLLLNAGIYRDRNLAEPALAALIQQDIGANPEEPHEDAHGTFSFDVANGTCGVLTALQIVDGFLKSRAIDCALVVASDADPGHGQSEDFPLTPTGASLLCSWTDEGRGLGEMCWANLSEHSDSFSATVGLRGGRRNILRLQQSPGIDEHYADAAASAVSRCLRESNLTIDDIDAVAAAPARPGFRAALADRLGIPTDRVTVGDDEGMHTAALASAFDRVSTAVDEGGLVLLVAAGAGITAGAALYRL
ncbi:3-oxoacyl-(acyl-carrier-protein) synthase III [Mycolicibacterium rhodesiae NBB3]|uniref:3-oxoacyl-(Acyl-carrier-protein) synthase III n=1 Tax=Mycolicibacterium rhodesiae (strain NBB3) TaxID=710685 RepID=G8RXX4_MYCRN|nr:3-oxoacyl-[acyl-carrier-protein] synthase III C-terminal domain-containing protein [Mycolicibacterium rhodesiae]AEV70667.1 3-oxoacyl-(acyl-carrier-protein) synthase III [Mycolicibacterium rhodesiae NBB3]